MHVYGEYKVQSKEYRVLCMICTIQQNRLEADQITPKEIQKTLPNAIAARDMNVVKSSIPDRSRPFKLYSTSKVQ